MSDGAGAGESASRTVAQKMGIKHGSRAHLVGTPPPAFVAMKLPALVESPDLDGEFDYLHLFTTSQASLEEAFPTLKRHVKATGMLWVSWPKAGKLGTDLSLPIVVKIGYPNRLVESTCLSVDDTWSALKFTHPKKGKNYHNSRGALPAM